MTTCPKCHYTRRSEDTAPDYECPKCGVIYAKAVKLASSTPAAVEDANKSKLRLVLVVLAVGAVGALGGWYGSKAGKTQGDTRAVASEKSEEATFIKRQEEEKNKKVLEKATADLNRLRERWRDASELAGSTARIALANPVAALQALRRETTEMVVPACLDDAKAELSDAIDQEIQGFMAFMQDDKLGKYVAIDFFSRSKDAAARYELRIKDACPKT